MDGSAAFFYNVSTQRADRTKRPSAHTNISVQSQAQPIKPTFKKKRSSTTTTITATPKEKELEGATSLSLPETNTSRKRMPRTSLTTSQNKSAISLGVQSINPSSSSQNNHLSHSATDRKHAPTAEQRTTGQQQRIDSRKEVRSESISSMSGTGSSSLTAITTGETPSSFEAIPSSFTRRHGRRYLRDATLNYPFPCDMPELHRQTLRTILYCTLFDGPICAPKYRKQPPKKVLDFACGTGYWSALCHQHYTKLGFPPISFTGLDIAPLAPHMNKEDGMDWSFIQSDFRKAIPVPDNTFDFTICKDLASAISMSSEKVFVMEELARVTKPGGILEIWDSDTSIRMLLPHTPASAKGDDENKDEIQEHADTTGTYIITNQTPFAAPQNQYLLDFNNWVSKVFEPRKLTTLPCTVIPSDVLQEADSLADMKYRRLAIPLSEVRWEREGVGGYVKLGPDGQARISAKGKAKEEDKKVLTAGQAALRRTALQTVVQMIESLEPLLREASGKGQDEWDRWWGNMMNDLMKNSGTSWGECLELGAWWATRRE